MAYQGRQPGVGVRNRFIYSATGGQTSFSGADSNGLTLAYADATYVDVFLNGTLLVPVTDYAATTKTSVVLGSGAAASDIVEIVAYDISSIANAVPTSGGTFTGAVTVQGNFSADGGTIKLDGNYPVGTANVALGDAALDDGSLSGGYNTAVGSAVLSDATSGNSNTAMGYQSLRYAITAAGNVSIGVNAMRDTTSGSSNIAVGQDALRSNTTASNNTAVGYQAGFSTTTAPESTMVGYQAGYSETTGGYNAFFGMKAGYAVTTGQENTFVGRFSGSAITTGGKNSILGKFSGNQGSLDIRTTSNNIVLSDGDGNPRLRISSTGSMGFNYPSLPSILSTDTGSPLYVFRPSGNANATANYLNFGGTNRNANGLSKMLTFNHGYWGAGREVAYAGVVTASSSGGSGSGSGNLVFGTGHSGNGDSGSSVTERMRLDSSGNLHIGRTSTGAVGNGHTIRGGDSAVFSRDAAGETVQVCRRNDQGDLIQFRRGGSVCGEIVNNGSSSVAYNTSSDYRLKENVVDLIGASARVNQLDVKRFNFIADGTDTVVDGFLAHEVADVVPEAVTGAKDAMRDEEYEVTPAVLDDNGNVTTEAVMGTRSVPKYQGIDQSKLVPLLTAALQEALAKIDALEARITTLEG